MKRLEVLLIASQLAFVICLPQDIRFVQPRRLRLRQVPTEIVSLGFANNANQGQLVPVNFRRVFPETIFISGSNQNQFVNSSPKLVISESPSVQFVPRPREGQDIPLNYVRLVPSEPQREGYRRFVVDHAGSPGQQTQIISEGTFQPRGHDVADHRNGFLVIPSEQTLEDTAQSNEKQEQRLPNPPVFIFRNSDVPAKPKQQSVEGGTRSSQLIAYRGSVVGNPETDIPGQTIDPSLQVQPDGHDYAIAGSLPLAVEKTTPRVEQEVRRPAEGPRSGATFVTRLTAPSSDPGASNTLMITKKPCEICCVDNEVQPCKSCCAFTPLLNPKTLKTVVG